MGQWSSGRGFVAVKLPSGKIVTTDGSYDTESEWLTDIEEQHRKRTAATKAPVPQRPVEVYQDVKDKLSGD